VNNVNKCKQLCILFYLFCFTTPVFAINQNKTLNTLDTSINKIRIRNNIAATAYVIVSGKKIIHSSVHGVSDKLTNRPATPNTTFRIGSITKSFTSLAILKLEQQGKISLKDDLLKHVSDAPLTNPWKNTNPVKIAHLLEHTSGLLDLTKKEMNYPGPEPLSLRQGLFFTNSYRKTIWPPGLHHSYSNAGAGYAAYALEKITGRNFEGYVEEEIFNPLDMKLASFNYDVAIKNKLATGYDTDGDTVIPYWHMTLKPFGAINATANGMANFVQMLINYGVYNNKIIFNKNLIRRMESPRTSLAATTGLEFGYGCGNYQYIHKGFLFHGHGGDGDGYLAHYAYNRDTDLGYFIVINAFNYQVLKKMRSKIEDYIIKDSNPPEIPTPIVLQKSHLKKFTGRYQAITHRFPWDKIAEIKADQVLIYMKNGSLQIKLPGSASNKLLPVTKNHFRYIDEPVATTAFIFHNDSLYFQGEIGNYIRIDNTRFH